jgi:hypothetical protein
MKKVKKMALGGIGAMAAGAANQAKQQAMAAGAANQTKQQAMAAGAANQAKQQAMAAGAPPRGPVKQANPFGMGMSAQQTAAINKQGAAAAKALGLGSAMSGPKTGLVAAMSGIKQPLLAQLLRAQHDKSMAQPAALPAAQRAQFAQQFQKAADITQTRALYDKNMAQSALGKKLGMKSGGSVSSASKRADGIAAKGKTKGRMC